MHWPRHGHRRLLYGLNMSGSFNSSCWINGYGWIAVALVIFANWNPALAVLGTFVFGFFQYPAGVGFQPGCRFSGGLAGWLLSPLSCQALPFLITAIVLVVSSIRQKGNGQPAALGPELLPGGAVSILFLRFHNPVRLYGRGVVFRSEMGPSGSPWREGRQGILAKDGTVAPSSCISSWRTGSTLTVCRFLL